MTFKELSEITGKGISALKQAFSRKKWSIRNAEDVRCYIALLGRTKQVRQRRGVRGGEHLVRYQFGGGGNKGEAVAVALREVRVFGGAAVPEGLVALMGECLGRGGVCGVVVFPGWEVKVILGAAVRQRQVGEWVKYRCASFSERGGVPLRSEVVTVSDALMWGALRPELWGGVRIEVGVVTLGGEPVSGKK